LREKLHRLLSGPVQILERNGKGLGNTAHGILRHLPAQGVAETVEFTDGPGGLSHCALQ
jgi:hypothetical protein